jgi:hypothetical protein
MPLAVLNQYSATGPGYTLPVTPARIVEDGVRGSKENPAGPSAGRHDQRQRSRAATCATRGSASSRFTLPVVVHHGSVQAHLRTPNDDQAHK